MELGCCFFLTLYNPRSAGIPQGRGRAAPVNIVSIRRCRIIFTLVLITVSQRPRSVSNRLITHVLSSSEHSNLIEDLCIRGPRHIRETAGKFQDFGCFGSPKKQETQEELPRFRQNSHCKDKFTVKIPTSSLAAAIGPLHIGWSSNISIPAPGTSDIHQARGRKRDLE